MSRENSSEVLPESRPILGDVTNQVNRRRTSSSLAAEVNKSWGGFHANLEIKEKERGKRVSRYISNCKSSIKRACTSPPWSCSEINSLKGNVISGISRIRSETKYSRSSDGVVPCPGSGNSTSQGAAETSDVRTDICLVSTANPRSSYDKDSVDVGGDRGSDDLRASSEETRSDPLCRQFDSSRAEDDDHGVDSFLCSQTGSVKDDVCFISNAAVDLFESCSCSFCTKAGYIWSDLYYQDVKGRLSALKKSQKEASILAQSCRKLETDRWNAGNPNSLNLESDLMGQWRSLFRHMEEIFGRESSQLESSLVALKDLRESCKAELESNSGIAPERQ